MKKAINCPSKEYLYREKRKVNVKYQIQHGTELQMNANLG